MLTKRNDERKEVLLELNENGTAENPVGWYLGW